MREFSVRNLVQMVDDRQLVLPAMQRPFVWDEDRMVRLMDSLLRGFPLGSLLVWSTDAAQRYRPFTRDARSTERPLDNFPRADGDRRLLYVLDGQQRLTTLYVATYGTLDGRSLYLDVFSGSSDGKDPGDTYWTFRFLNGQQLTRLNEVGETKKPRQHFVRFSRFMELGSLNASKGAIALARTLELADDEIDAVATAYSRAAATLDGTRLLGVHVIDDHGVMETPISEIMEIFVRVNSGGLRLHKSDLLMSLLDLKWENVQPALVTMSNEITAMSPVEVTRDMLLKTALLTIGEDSRFGKLVQDRDRVESIAPKMEARITDLDRAWRELVVLLKQDARILSKRFFRRATHALLPFAVYLVNNPSPTPTERRKITMGLYLALMSGVFGSAEARMGGFARNHCSATGPFPLQKLIDFVAHYRHVTSLDDLLRRHIDLTLNIAHDGNVILDGNPDSLERDHIFPQATLRKAGVPDHKINHYANLHFLRGVDNRNKTDRPPDEWFKTPGKGTPAYSDEDMKARLLSYELIEPGRFDDLLEERGAAIRRRALELFGMNLWAFNALFNGESAGDAWTRALKEALPDGVAVKEDLEEHAFTLDLGEDESVWVGRNSSWHKSYETWLWCGIQKEYLDAPNGEPAKVFAGLRDQFGSGHTDDDQEGDDEFVLLSLSWCKPADLAPVLDQLVKAIQATREK